MITIRLLLALVSLALPASAGDVIPGRFIVTLRPDAGDVGAHTQWVSEVHARNLERRANGAAASDGVDNTFDLGGLHAYSGSFDDVTLEMIKANASVLRVEPDKIVYVSALQTQNNAPWGLAAVSNKAPPLTSSAYSYDSTAGQGIFAYILDSGVLLEHTDFGGRAVLGINTHGESSDKLHGTIISGIVGGTTYGVAKKTTLIDVQVVGSVTGTLTSVVKGLDWALKDAVSKGRIGKSVINMSLSVQNSPTLNDAVQAVIDAGIPIVAAAGNSNENANLYSPANQPNVITVGASDKNYRRASFSNWGPSIDLFAPGVDISSLGSSNSTAIYISSGTSEAAPHVAGVVAYLLSLEGARTPAQMKARLLELSIKDVIQDPRQSANRFLYNGIR